MSSQDSPANFKRFHYGVTWYPEHWDNNMLEDDLRRMVDNGLDTVRIGEGAWAYFEPKQGEYQFELFDRVVALCEKHKLAVVFGTPTYCAPAWVSHNYPEVLRWDFNRIPMKHGSRRNFTYNSSVYNELSDNISHRLATHYAGAKPIFCWQIDNEFNCHMDASYSPCDTRAFQAWLARKYETLHALNEAWGTKFWSMTYSDWAQIDLPHPTAAPMNPSVLLDEVRFISDSAIAFCYRQAAIVRSANSGWLITHNGLFANINGPKLSSTIDTFSQDQYPLFMDNWADAATKLLEARSLSCPFGLLEQQAGPGGQAYFLHRTPRPGEIGLWATQSVAHGAKLLSYFTWRTCPFGAEQHWHGLLDADNHSTRRLGEAKLTGGRLRKLPNDFHDAVSGAQVAVLRDFDSETNWRKINTYFTAGYRDSSQQALMREHIPVDQLWTGQHTGEYKLIIAMHLGVATQSIVDELTDFVFRGGVLVLGARSGVYDEHLHVVRQRFPGLFAKLAGVIVEDWTQLPGGQWANQQADLVQFGDTRRAMFDDGLAVGCYSFVERLKPTTATPIATWDTDDSLLTKGVAVTMNKVGKGFVYYVGGAPTPLSARPLLARLCAAHDVKPVVAAGDSVEAVVRQGQKARYLALLNHSPVEQTVSQLPGGVELFTGKKVKSSLALGMYDTAVIKLGAP